MGKNMRRPFLDKRRYPFEVLNEFFGLKYKWAFWFLMIFPVGFFSYILFSRSKHQAAKAVFLSALIGLTVLGVVEGLQLVPLRREFNFFVLPVGTGIVLLSILASSILSKNVQVS